MDRSRPDRPPDAVQFRFNPGCDVAVFAARRVSARRSSFNALAGQCNLPDTSGDAFSADGTLEYAASGKSFLTVTPGCALNPATGLAQPFVNLFDNGGFLLNVSVNGVPLTQLSATWPRAAVFLRAGSNGITAANGTLSTDIYVREGGSGSCALWPVRPLRRGGACLQFPVVVPTRGRATLAVTYCYQCAPRHA